MHIYNTCNVSKFTLYYCKIYLQTSYFIVFILFQKGNDSTYVDRSSKACKRCEESLVIIKNQEDEIRALRILNKDLQKEVIDKMKTFTRKNCAVLFILLCSTFNY